MSDSALATPAPENPENNGNAGDGSTVGESYIEQAGYPPQYRKYIKALKSLPPSGGGGCHAALLSVANLGRIAGQAQQDIFRSLRSHTMGTRSVPDEEIWAAIRKAFADVAPSVRHQKKTHVPQVDSRLILNALLAEGASGTEASLKTLSPVPIENDRLLVATSVLRGLYKPTDKLFLGERVDKNPANIKSVDEWVEGFASADMPPPHIIPNPLTGTQGKTKDGKPSYRSDDCVAEFKFAVLEIDKTPPLLRAPGETPQDWPLEQQFKFWFGAIKLGLPIALLVKSGGRSVHAWVRLAGVQDQASWSVKVGQDIFNLLVPCGIDGACRNPSRLSRTPGHQRAETGEWQDLLYLNSGGDADGEEAGAILLRIAQNVGAVITAPADLQPDANTKAVQRLPEIIRLDQFLTKPVPLPVHIVSDFLSIGEKAILGAPSASFKSWILLHLGFCVSNGLPWLGFKTTMCKVLYINLELRESDIQRRLKSIVGRFDEARTGNLHLHNLASHDVSLPELTEHIRENAAGEGYGLIIPDPVYKLALRDGRSENEAQDVAAFYRELDEMLRGTGAAVMFAAHFAKGNSAQKNALDRVSGSGVWMRNPDTRIVLTPHQQQDTFSMEIVPRAAKRPEPFCIRWEYPMMVRDELADPKSLRGAGGPKPKATPADLVSLLPDGGLETAEWQQLAESRLGVGRSAFFSARKSGVDKLYKEQDGKWVSIRRSAPPVSGEDLDLAS